MTSGQPGDIHADRDGTAPAGASRPVRVLGTVLYLVGLAALVAIFLMLLYGMPLPGVGG
jgi:hypothetical protein